MTSLQLNNNNIDNTNNVQVQQYIVTVRKKYTKIKKKFQKKMKQYLSQSVFASEYFQDLKNILDFF